MYNKYTGIILKKYPLGEADELLTIYTRETGKLRVKAVSSRKIQSKLSGHLSSLNEIAFETAGGRINRRSFPTAPKRSVATASSEGGLPVIISVRALSINNYLRQNLRKFAFALVAVETLYRITADGQGNSGIYECLSNFLKNLGESPDENLEVRRFQLELLAASGYGLPESIIPYSRHPFGFRAGSEGTPEGSQRRDSSSDPGRTQNGKSFLTPDLERAIDKHLNYVLEREIKSTKFLAEI